MPIFIPERRVWSRISTCCSVLIASASLANTEFDVADAISESCLPVGTFEGSSADWMSRDLPTEIYVDVVQSRQRAWVENLLQALTSRTLNIPPSARKKFQATVSWEIDGHYCEHDAEIRLNGDMKDHISYQGSEVIASVSVKLLTGHIGNIVRFKLLLPETRVGENEILAILFYREFGFISPETRLVTGYLNGIRTEYLFQESPAKEFMEANNLRESMLVEGDERWRWMMQSRPDVYSDILLKETIRVENRVFARADNRGWLDNPTSTMIGATGLTVANRLYHQYHVDKPSRTGGETHLGLTSSYRLRQNSEVIRDESLFVLLAKVFYSSHALRVHNRKYYYDPTYQNLIPIYYDGMALRDADNLSARFPRNGTFPKEEIDLVTGKLSDDKVREKIYMELVARGGKTSREDFESLVDTVLARARALEPRPSDPPDEPLPAVELDLPLLLLEEEGDYQFFGFNVATGRFQLCTATPDVDDGRRPTCVDATAEPREILSESVAENGDPIPFIGGFSRTETGGLQLTLPKGRRTRTESNPENLDVTVAADELLILDFDDDLDAEVVRKYHLKMEASGSTAGKVLVRGKVPDGADFVVTGNGGTIGLTRYDERLLTGCLTFLDASLNEVRISASNVPCEDSVNFVRTDGTVSRLVVDSAFADAIDADFSDLQFDRIEISAAANDCIDLSAGRYQVANLIATGCGDKGLSVGERAVVFLDYLEVTDAVFGAVAKDSSYLYIDSAAFDTVGSCLAAYRKKQEFDGARIEFSESVAMQCPEERMKIQPGSVAAAASAD